MKDNSIDLNNIFILEDFQLSEYEKLTINSSRASPYSPKPITSKETKYCSSFPPIKEVDFSFMLSVKMIHKIMCHCRCMILPLNIRHV